MSRTSSAHIFSGAKCPGPTPCDRLHMRGQLFLHQWGLPATGAKARGSISWVSGQSEANSAAESFASHADCDSSCFVRSEGHSVADAFTAKTSNGHRDL